MVDRKDGASKKASKEHMRSMVYGAAVGDALGVPYEFMPRGSFRCTGMAEGGAHGVPRGTFSDDTSMILATCDSLRAKRGKVDPKDIRKRFEGWAYGGSYTSDGRVFDIGTTVATALSEGRGPTHERSNGNGSLMRIAPLAFVDATDEQIREVSAVTHGHELSMDACVAFVHVIRDAVRGQSILEGIRSNAPALEAIGVPMPLPDVSEEDISSGGYVLDTLTAALWCAVRTDSYRDCVLDAVNLGRDTDTTACVAGALAGSVYGYDAIPSEWIEELRGKDVIEACL